MTTPHGSNSLIAAISLLRRHLPRGSTLDVAIHADHLWLELIRLPEGKDRQGIGSATLAKLLHLTDEAGLPVRLRADASDDLDRPATVDLVRWYARFGFVPLSMDEGGVVMMSRAAQPVRPAQVIEAQAQAAKAHDLTWEAFATWEPFGLAAHDGDPTVFALAQAHWQALTGPGAHPSPAPIDANASHLQVTPSPYRTRGRPRR